MCVLNARLISDLDIWRSAQLYITAHGGEAAIFAAFQADKHMADGDMDGYAVWVRIVRAIDALIEVDKTGVAH